MVSLNLRKGERERERERERGLLPVKLKE